MLRLTITFEPLAVPPAPACGVDEYLGLDGKCHKKGLNKPGQKSAPTWAENLVFKAICKGIDCPKHCNCAAENPLDYDSYGCTCP